MSSVGEGVDFEVRAWPDRYRVFVAVRGELDVANVDDVRAALDELRGAGWTSIVLDLRAVTFIDSTGDRRSPSGVTPQVGRCAT